MGPLMFAHQPLPRHASQLNSRSRLLSQLNNATMSPEPSALNPSKSSPTKSAHTLMKPRTSKPPPRPSKLPSTRNPTPKWSPSANQDMEDMDTNAVTKLPKKPNTTYHLSQLLNHQ